MPKSQASGKGHSSSNLVTWIRCSFSVLVCYASVLTSPATPSTATAEGQSHRYPKPVKGKVSISFAVLVHLNLEEPLWDKSKQLEQQLDRQQSTTGQRFGWITQCNYVYLQFYRAQNNLPPLPHYWPSIWGLTDLNEASHCLSQIVILISFLHFSFCYSSAAVTGTDFPRFYLGWAIQKNKYITLWLMCI